MADFDLQKVIELLKEGRLLVGSTATASGIRGEYFVPEEPALRLVAEVDRLQKNLQAEEFAQRHDRAEIEALRAEIGRLQAVEHDLRSERWVKHNAELIRENTRLRKELEDRRAHDVRMLAIETYGIGAVNLDEGDMTRVAEAYDRVMGIEVPAQKGVDRG